MTKDIVYTIAHWYDGALEGLADFNGQPHQYESYWQDLTSDEWVAHYWLTPLDADSFRLAMEQWNMWERWQAAFDAETTAIETHPTLPQDQKRYGEIEALLQQRRQAQLAAKPELRLKAKGVFYYGSESFVEWTVLK